MAEQETNLIEVLQRFMAPGTAPIGVVFPPRSDAPNLPDLGAREHALRRFLDFLACLPFMRTMAGPPQAFVVPRDQMFINAPEAEAGAPIGQKLPTIAFTTSTADKILDGWLGPAILIEGTEDVFAPDTALFWIGGHTEPLVLEVVASSRAVRRSITEGITQVLRSSDDTGALRLSLPDYFGGDATFTLMDVTYLEEPDAVRNRRKAHLTIQLYVDEVLLANAVDIRPYLTATVGVQVQTTVQVEQG
jgi:hypothetical protein